MLEGVYHTLPRKELFPQLRGGLNYTKTVSSRSTFAIVEAVLMRSILNKFQALCLRLLSDRRFSDDMLNSSLTVFPEVEITLTKKSL